MFTNGTNKRNIIDNGPHSSEVLNILRNEIKNEASLSVVIEKAKQIVEKSVDPNAKQSHHSTDGLLYGLIQSGKTSIITVTTAIAADNGFQSIIILTSDIDPLYYQTLDRLSKALRGLNILGKDAWRDVDRFKQHLKSPPFVIVCSKNGSKLNGLLEAFKKSTVDKDISVMIIDDEADQASLNTFSNKNTGEISRINAIITELRNYFKVNTYLQVTATPQALFLQRPDHKYHPSFTVLSSPGKGYIGGEDFFGSETDNCILEYVDIQEIQQLKSTHQPATNDNIPIGLKKALYVFFYWSYSENYTKFY